MSQFPSLPLFTDAYIADTQHLSNEEHGAYLRLLMFAWRTADCRLADDDGRIARMLGLTVGKWLKLKPAVMDFWTLSDGFWQQKRLAKEHEFVAKKVEQNRSNGSKGGRPKSLEDMEVAEAAGSQEKTETKAPTPTPTKAASAASVLRAEIAQIFAEAGRMPPDTSLAVAWLKRGHDPEFVLAMIREGLARKPDIGSLSYFDRRLADVAAAGSAPAPASAAGDGGHAPKPRALPTPDQIRRVQIRFAAEHFRGHFSDGWPNENRPGHPDCTLPEDVIDEARLLVATERGMSVAELGATAH